MPRPFPCLMEAKKKPRRKPTSHTLLAGLKIHPSLAVAVVEADFVEEKPPSELTQIATVGVAEYLLQELLDRALNLASERGEVDATDLAEAIDKCPLLSRILEVAGVEFADTIVPLDSPDEVIRNFKAVDAKRARKEETCG